MVALLANRLGERAREVVAGAQTGDDGREVVRRLPAERGAGARIDVDPVDAGKHAPAAPRIFGLEFRYAPAQRAWRIGAQLREVFGAKRRGRADDVFAE